MPMLFQRRVLAVCVLASLSLTGLAGCSKQGGQPEPKPAVAEQAKPPLEIPKQFASMTERQVFAAGAVHNGYYAEAKVVLEAAIAVDPAALSYQLLGTSLYNLRDYKGAMDAWAKAAERDQTLKGEMQNNIGNALRDSGQLAEAEAAYLSALKIEPTRWTAAINLAALLKDADRLKEAVQILEKAASNNPEVKELGDFLSTYKSEVKQG